MSAFKEQPIIRQLRSEHEVVERVAGTLFRWAHEGQEVEPAARAVFVDFFSLWVGGLHHDQEEEILFRALVDRAEIPADSGPLMVIGREHGQGQRLVSALAEAAAGAETISVATRLSGLLLLHVDKENSVLFPEAAERLSRSGVAELVGRAESTDETRVRSAAEKLVERWPPIDDPDLFRGDGCMACSAFGDACDGIEREWWNAWEWDHHRSMQE